MSRNKKNIDTINLPDEDLNKIIAILKKRTEKSTPKDSEKNIEQIIGKAFENHKYNSAINLAYKFASLLMVCLTIILSVFIYATKKYPSPLLSFNAYIIIYAIGIICTIGVISACIGFSCFKKRISKITIIEGDSKNDPYK